MPIHNSVLPSVIRRICRERPAMKLLTLLPALAMAILGCSPAESRHTVVPPAEAARLNDSEWTLLSTPKPEFKRLHPVTGTASPP